MAEIKVNDTAKNVQKSVGSIYAQLLQKRKTEREEKEEQRRLEKEAKKAERELNPEEDRPMTKKEKRESKLDAWNEILHGLTGDDLDYISPKKNKKKYRKWIGDETENNAILTAKPQKKKKRNYNKEFEPELNMLKSIVADQNKFTFDLLRRYQNAAGPNTKDGMPLNKTLVELAAVINTSRGNSLGVLREIGNVKKTIAELYMKQKKLDQELGVGGGFDNDLGIMGSNIAASMFNPGGNIIHQENPVSHNIPQQQYPSQPTQPKQISSGPFDPSTWAGDGLDGGATKFESIPHTIVVEWHKAFNQARFKAIDNATGEELVGCPVPTCQVKAIDESTMMAKDDFDQVYKIQVVDSDKEFEKYVKSDFVKSLTNL